MRRQRKAEGRLEQNRRSEPAEAPDAFEKPLLARVQVTPEAVSDPWLTAGKETDPSVLKLN